VATQHTPRGRPHVSSSGSHDLALIYPGMARDFYGVYLLASQALTAKGRPNGRTYVGFTVNPRRRIRQHNGEITSGAWRTKACGAL